MKIFGKMAGDLLAGLSWGFSTYSMPKLFFLNWIEERLFQFTLVVEYELFRF